MTHGQHRPSRSTITPGDADRRSEGKLYGLLAEYDTPGELVDAAKKVRDAGYTDFDCYSPFPVHGIDEAMGIKRTILPLLIFGGGFTGTVGGVALQWYCNAYKWGWNISGKPTWSLPANIPIAFECTILFSVLTAFFGMWMLNKLPQVWHPFFRSERFGRVTDDAFLLGIESNDKRFDLEATKKLLSDAGAIAVEPCHRDPDPSNAVMPKWLLAFIIASTAFALIPFAIAAKARTSHSNEPHIHIFPDMDFQPKYKSDQAMDLFGDGRENRGELAGTIARGSLNADDLFYRGLENGDWTHRLPEDGTPDGRPFVVDAKLLKRGQNRFNIYCTPCHGYDGHGNGAIPQRLVKIGAPPWQARNLVDPAQDAVRMPNGQVFNTISNGFSTHDGLRGARSRRLFAGRSSATCGRSSARRTPASTTFPPISARTCPAAGMPEAPTHEPREYPASRREDQGRQDRRHADQGRRDRRGRVPRHLARPRRHLRRRRGPPLEAIPLRLRDRLDVHLQHLRRRAVARAAAPPGARPLGDRGASHLRGHRGRDPARVRRGARLRDPAARRLQEPLLLGAPPGRRTTAPRAQRDAAAQARLARARLLHGALRDLRRRVQRDRGVLREEVARAGRVG